MSLCLQEKSYRLRPSPAARVSTHPPPLFPLIPLAMCLCLYAVAETTIIARDSDPIDCASETHIAKLHFYDLPLTTECHIYLTNRLPTSCANHGLHLICVHHSRHKVIDYTKVKGVNKQSQIEGDISMFFLLTRIYLFTPFDPMEIMIYPHFSSRYIM